MLTLHYNASGKTLTSGQMSERMGWDGRAASQHYGRLAHRVSKQLDWVPTDRSDNCHVWSLALVSRNPQNDAYEWKMREEVAEALELLKWPGLKKSRGSKPTHGAESITERRRYAWQLRLERKSGAAKRAKARYGYKCQACSMSFSDMYGDIGAEFIEAHHLVPLSDIEPGEKRVYTPDHFAVLWSNCHRMIHRWPDPGDFDGFRRMIQARRKTKPG